MSKMQSECLRTGHGVCMRKVSWPGQNLRLPVGQDHPATTDRAGTDGEAPDDREDRFAAPVYFKKRPAILRVSCKRVRRKSWLRVRSACGEKNRRNRHQQTGATQETETRRTKTRLQEGCQGREENARKKENCLKLPADPFPALSYLAAQMGVLRIHRLSTQCADEVAMQVHRGHVREEIREPMIHRRPRRPDARPAHSAR